MNGSRVSRPIVILGVDRSGTSMVANMVHAWGAAGGDSDQLARRNRWNRYGNWENTRFQGLVVELLERCDVPYWERGYRDALIEHAHEAVMKSKAERFVAAITSASPAAWFVKEPWLSVQLPFWQRFLGDAVYIVTVRNPRECADSLAPRLIPNEASGVSLVAFLLLRWQVFLLSILRDTPAARTLFVEYERATRSPRVEAERINEFLCRTCGVAPEGRAARMIDIVRPEERHQTAASFDDEVCATDGQKALYRYLLRKIDEPDLPFDAADYPLYPGYAEYFQNMAWTMAYISRTRRMMRMMESYPVRMGIAINNALDAMRRFRATSKPRPNP